MSTSPWLRKLALTTHVTASVGWLGAVVAFLALAVIGLTSEDPQTVRGAYLVMEPAAWLVLVPLAFASLLTGIVGSLATTWGVLRHYWVLFKLLINVVTTTALLAYMQTFAVMAAAAADPHTALSAVRDPSPVIHAGAALLLLLAAAVLSVYKPRGITRYGWRKQQQQRGGTAVGQPLGQNRIIQAGASRPSRAARTRAESTVTSTTAATTGRTVHAALEPRPGASPP